MTRDEAKLWLNRFGDMPEGTRHPCRHGHGDCSIDPKGPCLDDVIRAAIPEPDPVPCLS